MKIFIKNLVLAFVLSLVLSACGSKSSSNDSADTPTKITLSANSIDEGNSLNSIIGTLSSNSSSNSFTFSLVAGSGDTDNASFTITNNSLFINAITNYNVKNSYTIRINVSDGTDNFSKAFTIAVNNINTSPTDIILSSNNIDENNAPNAIVGTLTTADDDTSNLTYSLVSGTGSDNNNDFEIVNNSLKIIRITNYEVKSSYSIRLKVNDGANNYEKSFTIVINDVVEPNHPSDIGLDNNSTDENVAANSTIGLLSTVDDGSVFTYTFNGGTDDNLFDIVGNVLKIKNSPNYEIKNLYSIRINTRDIDNNTINKDFNITINDLNDPAIFTTTPTLTAVLEGDTFSYTANITDEDGNLTAQSGYTTVDSGDGTNNLTVSITKTFVDSDVGPFPFSIVVNQTGSPGTVTQSFNVPVTDLNSAPTHNVIAETDINFGDPETITLNIADGDSKVQQDMNISIDSNDTTILTLTQDVSNNINDNNATAPVDIVLTGVKIGIAKVTVTIVDGGSTGGSHVNNKSFDFNVTVRGSGHQYYEDNNVSAPTTPIVFDTITYDWNASAEWYENIDGNGTVLLPIENIDDADKTNNFTITKSTTEKTYLGANVYKKSIGHYYVKKEEYIYDSSTYAESNSPTFYTSAKTFSSALSGTDITAKNLNFAHDAINNYFITFVSKNIHKASDFTTTNFCENEYGNNWRLPNASADIGNTGANSQKYGEYRAGYVGDNTSYVSSTDTLTPTMKMITSTLDSTFGTYLTLNPVNAAWDFVTDDTKDIHYKCVYDK